MYRAPLPAFGPEPKGHPAHAHSGICMHAGRYNAINETRENERHVTWIVTARSAIPCKVRPLIMALASTTATLGFSSAQFTVDSTTTSASFRAIAAQDMASRLA